MNNKVISINNVPIHVEVADTEDLRQQGLMNRSSLQGGSGMIFIFQKPDMLGFWMKNTRIPLSIAFVSSEGEILNIEDMNPHDMTTVKSLGDAKCAIEVPQGWFRKNGIKSGDIVDGLNDRVVITESQIRKLVREILV